MDRRCIRRLKKCLFIHQNSATAIPDCVPPPKLRDFRTLRSLSLANSLIRLCRRSWVSAEIGVGSGEVSCTALLGRTPRVKVDFSKVPHGFGPKLLKSVRQSVREFLVPD